MTNRPSKRLLTFLFLLTGLLSLLLPAVSSGLEVPQLQGRVNDYGAMLSSGTKQQLEQLLQVLEQQESTQIVVLTINSLEGDNLENFSIRVVEKWKIGQKGLDNGVLLLIAKEDRKLRIEVGYGLEGKLTDLVAGRIIRDVITPKFKMGNFDQGVIDGINSLVSVVRGEFDDQMRNIDTREKERNHRDGLIGFTVFIFFFISKIFREKPLIAAAIGAVAAPLIGHFVFNTSLPVTLFLIFLGGNAGFIFSSIGTGGSGRSSSGWSTGSTGSYGGGFSSGGGFSGGGGGFGGGGASGSW